MSQILHEHYETDNRIVAQTRFKTSKDFDWACSFCGKPAFNRYTTSGKEIFKCNKCIDKEFKYATTNDRSEESV